MSDMAERSEKIEVYCDSDLKQSVRVRAAKRDMSMAEYVRSLLREAGDDT